MKYLLTASILTVALVLSAALSHGSGRVDAPSQHFKAATSFEHITTSTAFACNKRDPSGRTFGTAHETTHRSVYVFFADGTATVDSGFGLSNHATYSIKNRKLSIVHLDDSGLPAHEQVLELSKDGQRLGAMTRLP